MQPDPAIQRRRIAAMQPVNGFQSEPRDPFMESYKLMCFSMLNTFVLDLQRYRRWEKRRCIPVKPGIVHQNELIQLAYRSALRWAMDESDYFLSLDECCDELGIDSDEFLDRYGLA